MRIKIEAEEVKGLAIELGGGEEENLLLRAELARMRAREEAWQEAWKGEE